LLSVNYLGHILAVHQIRGLINRLAPMCHGLCDLVELMLERNSEFRDYFTRMLLEQNQPCVIQALPPISVGQTGAISVPHVKSDPDPERWSKTCNKLEYFSPPQCSRPIPPNNPSEDYINSLHIVRLHMCISHKS